MKKILIIVATILISASVAFAAPPPYSPKNESCRILDISSTAFTNSGTGEETAYTYTLPAGTMDNDGDIVKVTFTGTTGLGDASQNVKLYFGSTSRALGGAGGGSGWGYYTTIARTGAATQYMTTDFWRRPTTRNIVTDAPTETLSGAVVIKATVTAGNGDTITTIGNWRVEFCPAP